MTKKKIFYLVGFILILIAIPVTFYLVKQTQIFKPRAQEISQGETKITVLSNKLIATEKEAEKAKTPEEKTRVTQELVAIAKERKTEALKQIQTDPAKFLQNAIPEQTKATLPTPVQEQVEQRVQTQGELTVLHQDDFTNNRSSTSYLLNAQGQNYNLHFATNPPSLLTGSQVSVTGVNLDNNVVLASGDSSGTNTQFQTLQAATLNVTGQKRVAVLLVRLNQNMRPSITREQVQQALFDGPNSVSTFLRETSFNHILLTGGIFGWFTLNYSEQPGGGFVQVPPVFKSLYPGTLPPGFFVTEDVMNEADSAARNEGVNLDVYDYIMYIIPIGGGGEADLGGRRSIIWRVNIDPRVMVHELGHNLGVNHANLVTCGNKQIDNYQRCSFTEYGEATTVMGNVNVANTYHFNGPNKVSFGWIPQSRVREVTSDSVYTISPPIEVDGTGTQAIKIRKPDTNEYYYLSYKQPIGFDAVILTEYPGDRSTRTIRGVRINTWDEVPSDRTNIVLAQPQGLTGNFPTFGEYEPLGDGMSFYDQINRIQITQLSHDANSVTVDVKFNVLPTPTPTPSPTPTPTITPSPSPSPIIPGTFTNLTANLSLTNARFQFDFSGTSPNFIVEISDGSDMRGTFRSAIAEGISSPIVNSHVNLDPLFCGTKIYWRVFNSDRTISSPIQSVLLECIFPSPSLTPTSSPILAPTLTPTPTPTPTPSPTPVIRTVSNITAAVGTNNPSTLNIEGQVIQPFRLAAQNSPQTFTIFIEYSDGRRVPLIINMVYRASGTLNPSPTPSPSLIPTPLPTLIPSPTPSPSPSPTPSLTLIPSPSPSPSPTPSQAPVNIMTITAAIGSGTQEAQQLDTRGVNRNIFRLASSAQPQTFTIFIEYSDGRRVPLIINMIYRAPAIPSPTPSPTPSPILRPSPSPIPSPSSPPSPSTTYTGTVMKTCRGIDCGNGGDLLCAATYGTENRCWSSGAGSGRCVKSSWVGRPFAGPTDCSLP